MELEKRFSNIVCEIIEEISPEHLMLDQLIEKIGINSLSFMQLIVACEKEFDVEFDGEDLDYQNYQTLNDLKEKLILLNQIKTL